MYSNKNNDNVLDKVSTGFDRIYLDLTSTGFQWFTLDFSGFLWISLDFNGLHWITLDFTWLNVSPDV